MQGSSGCWDQTTVFRKRAYRRTPVLSTESVEENCGEREGAPFWEVPGSWRWQHSIYILFPRCRSAQQVDLLPAPVLLKRKKRQFRSKVRELPGKGMTGAETCPLFVPTQHFLAAGVVWKKYMELGLKTCQTCCAQGPEEPDHGQSVRHVLKVTVPIRITWEMATAQGNLSGAHRYSGVGHVCRTTHTSLSYPQATFGLWQSWPNWCETQPPQSGDMTFSLSQIRYSLLFHGHHLSPSLSPCQQFLIGFCAPRLVVPEVIL